MSRERASAGAASAGERMIFGVPARYMTPRILAIAATIVLVSFGLLMVYSASSITALTSADYGNDPTYFLTRQAFSVGIGVVMAIILARIDYRVFTGQAAYLIWGGTVVLLLLVLTSAAGADAYGAVRWLSIAGFTFQPSEFAKVSAVIVAATIASRYYETRELDFKHFAVMLGAGLGSILVLVLFQPDKGTTAIIGITLIVMGFLAGVPARVIVPTICVLGAIFAFMSFNDDYSRRRIMTMLNPWADYYGDGYQLIQGYYAFGSGGLFGVGLGNSSQKYSYLPMAHNDFIFAVIGEELGLVGTLGVLALFGVLCWAGYRIARYSDDLAGRLIAAGCSTLIWVQLVINIAGVLGIMPLTGKPVPFLSYGGSTVMSCLMLVGLMLSVSIHSKLPETVHDEVRERMVMAYDHRDRGLSFAGEARPRSERTASPAPSAPGFTFSSTPLGGARAEGAPDRKSVV